MEYNDWTPQSITTVVAGALATIALIAATAYSFTKGGTVNPAAVRTDGGLGSRPRDVSPPGPVFN